MEKIKVTYPGLTATITSIEYEDGFLGDSNLMKFFCKVEKLAQNKLNIVNLIYEISRI